MSNIMNIDTITFTEIILLFAVLSAIGYKGCNYIIGSNCTEISFCGCSCKRQALSEEGCLEVLSNQTHVPHESIHTMIIEELKDIENK
jgi:hypothetical protein